MKLKPLFLDFETFWSPTHSLSKMSPIEYATHPDTEIISLAARSVNKPAQVVFGEGNIQRLCANTDWSDKWVIAHNMEGFDAMLLAWRLGARPAMWGCTLAMARPIHAKTTGLSLAKLVEHYGIGVKNNAALINTKGRHLCDFTPEEIEAMREYNADDTNQCRDLFLKLLPQTSTDELCIIDRTIRMLVEPQFVLDKSLLVHTLAAERVRKKRSLLALATDLGHPTKDEADAIEFLRSELASAPKFAAQLTARGVEVPMKESPTSPGKMIPALSKSDEGFLALQEHEDELVAAMARARLDVKSTLLETRIESFLTAGEAVGGKLPIPTKYYGADTTGRRSGWAYNPLNLPRINPDKPKPSDALRMSLCAPEGYKIVVADLSGIELRVNMFLWQVPYAMALFRADPEKADLYKALASEVMGVPIEGMPKMVRQAGKAMHLGCGFGLGSQDKYIAVAKTMAQIVVTPEEAAEHIAGYRRKHPEIVQGWKTCHSALDAIAVGAEQPIDPWEMCWTCAEGIRTPRGMIRYPNLRKERNEEGKAEWFYGEGRHKARIYAGKVDENIVQHLARTALVGYDLEFSRTKVGRNLPLALEVYDELVYIVPEDEAEEALDTLQGIMRSPLPWWPELVTWSEGGIADRYGEAK